MKRANKILIIISILIMLFLAVFLIANMAINFAGLVIGEIETEGGLEVQDFQSVIYLSKNIEKEVLLSIYNSGDEPLTNISLELEELPDIYNISPRAITQLEQGDTAIFAIKFLSKDPLEETNFTYKIKTNELTKIESGIFAVLGIADFFEKEVGLLGIAIQELTQNTTDEELLAELKRCADIIAVIDKNIKEEEFINAQGNLREATDCFAEVKAKDEKKPLLPKIKMDVYWIWIAIGSLAFILIVIIIFLLYLLYKKFSILSFVREEGGRLPVNPSGTPEKESFEDRIKDIESKLK
jgi:flagellar basal body-associated protein FliL